MRAEGVSDLARGVHAPMTGKRAQAFLRVGAGASASACVCAPGEGRQSNNHYRRCHRGQQKIYFSCRFMRRS
jgi:hypothetical protein